MKHLFRLIGSINKNEWSFTPGELHHAFKVLRLSSGAILEVCDGAGRVDRCEIISIGKSNLQLKILGSETLPLRKLPTTLLCPALDHGVLDEVLAGFVEAGVDALWMYLPDGADKKRIGPKKIERWQQKVAGAVKQSKRAHQPQIRSFQSLAAAVEELEAPSRLYFGCQSGSGPNDLVYSDPSAESQPKTLAFACGAEKGLSPDELKILGKSAGQGVCLSPYVLRAKTAALMGVQFLEQVRTACLP